MAAADTTQISVSAPRGVGIFASLHAAISDWNDRRNTRNALDKLTDRELNDIGLSRADIQNF